MSPRASVKAWRLCMASWASQILSGIDGSCGGMCNVCLAYLSVPVISFSVPKGGDYIDTTAASVRGLGTSIRVGKERGFRFNGFFENKVVSRADRLPRRPDPDSGTVHARRLFQRCAPSQAQESSTADFAEASSCRLDSRRYEKVPRAESFPIALTEIRTAADPLALHCQ
jgi:hypothetical protein